MISLRDLELRDRERSLTRRAILLKEIARALLLLVAATALILLMAGIAHARLERESGWQIHIYYAQPINNRQWNTIGPPFPDKKLCEEVAFPILIERIQDRVRCVYVDELYVRK